MARKAFEQTTVPVAKTKGEVEALLVRYGATQFGIMQEAGRALIGFTVRGRTVRIEIPLPDRTKGARSAAGGRLGPGSPAALKIHEQEERRIWRAARAWVFARLEAVESGLVTFETAFLAETVLPSGQTFAEWAEPQIKAHLLKGEMPALLPPKISPPSLD